jgi:hypothetical protein
LPLYHAHTEPRRAKFACSGYAKILPIIYGVFGEDVGEEFVGTGELCKGEVVFKESIFETKV